MSIKKGFNEDGWREFCWWEVVSLLDIFGYLRGYF